MKLILASASPRRAEILRSAGLSFEIAAANVDETPLPNESPEQLVRRLALVKAEAAIRSRRDGEAAVVLGADTIVLVGDHVLGKPGTSARAIEMLRELQGREHRVITGVAAVASASGQSLTEVESTTVWFDAMTESEIAGYVATGEPLDKAGAYAIQGIASRYISKIEGDYFNVVGLPIARVWKMLRRLGYREAIAK